MFVSQSDFEFPMPTELVEPGSRYWRAVELSLNTSWFVATLCSTDEDQGYRRTMLVSWDTDLVHILENMIGGYLEALLFMAPPWHASDGLWRTHRIKRISRAYDADRDNEPALIFTTSEGQQIQGQLAESAPGSMHGHELLVTVGQRPKRDEDLSSTGRPLKRSTRRTSAKGS